MSWEAFFNINDSITLQLQLWKWTFLNSRLLGRLCGWIYSQIWHNVGLKELHQRQKKGAGTKKALEKKGWKHPCKQHDSRELCTPGRGERLHSAVLGTSHITHTSQLHFIEVAALSSLLQCNKAEHGLSYICSLQAEISGSTTPPLLCCAGQFFEAQSAAQKPAAQKSSQTFPRTLTDRTFQIGSGYCKVPMAQPIRQLPTRSQEQGWAPWQWQLHEIL